MRKFTKNIAIFIKLLGESFGFAMSSVRADKMRAFLSLLGVTIGIFSIVAVFSAIDSLESNVRKSFEAMGSDVVYVDKWSWYNEDQGQEYKWWEYRQRPAATYEEFVYLQQNCVHAEAIALWLSFGQEVKYGRKSLPNSAISGATADWNLVSSFNVEKGRYFSAMEANSSQNVAIIGAVIAKDLFGDEDPIGKVLKIGGNNTRVIGVLKEEGNSISITNYDYIVMIPYHYACTMVDPRWIEPSIALNKKTSADKEDFLGEIRMHLRNLRRLKPSQKDNFSINEMTVFQDMVSEIFGVISLAGWIIGGFSILIGGFGVANIMFVSVKERTSIIGIQKALGAKNYFILTQFLFEAALLAMMGGIVGILIVFIGTELVSRAYDFEMTLTVGNILRGVLVSSAIGVISGFVPAYMAAHLNPVEAINSK